jgi:hypothetical protein
VGLVIAPAPSSPVRIGQRQSLQLACLARRNEGASDRRFQPASLQGHAELRPGRMPRARAVVHAHSNRPRRTLDRAAAVRAGDLGRIICGQRGWTLVHSPSLADAMVGRSQVRDRPRAEQEVPGAGAGGRTRTDDLPLTRQVGPRTPWPLPATLVAFVTTRTPSLPPVAAVSHTFAAMT